MKFIQWLLLIIALIVLCIGSFFFYMRYHDGPIEVFAGGPFQAGTVLEGTNPDWDRFKDLATFEVQSLVPPRSRTTWLVVVDDRLFIPSGYMNTAFGKLWKQWPKNAVKDGRILIRVGDDIYPQQLVRLPASDPLMPAITEALSEKYSGEATVAHVEAGDTWMFEVVPRSAD